MLEDLGFDIESSGMEPYLIPGVSPGKNTPIVTTFLDDPEKLAQYDEFNTLGTEATMTEKIKHQREVCFACKTYCIFLKNFF